MGHYDTFYEAEANEKYALKKKKITDRMFKVSALHNGPIETVVYGEIDTKIQSLKKRYAEMEDNSSSDFFLKKQYDNLFCELIQTLDLLNKQVNALYLKDFK